MSYSPSDNEQLVEIISSDALRIILAHFHKVIFNCLYRERKRHLHLIGKRKLTWSLDWCKNELSPAF